MKPSVKKLQTQIERDLDWRLAELAVLREIITLETKNTIRTRVLFRSAWAMLYAHYEGFCKTSLELYSEFLSTLSSCAELPHCTFMHIHEKKFKTTKQMTIVEAYNFFTNEVANIKQSPPPSVTVDTKSNLWPNLLEEILIAFDIDLSYILDDRMKLKTLVGQRNDIAHGQRVFIKDIDYYLEYETAAQNTMYALALALVDRASKF